jgi:phosphoribosylanthranilate isomerase
VTVRRHEDSGGAVPALQGVAMLTPVSPLVKICGLSTAETVDAAIEASADLVGFVFFERSPRHVTSDLAAELGRRVGNRAGKVALTVDAGDETLDVAVLSLRPDMLQLHGSETPERVVAIKERYGLPVIKALGIGSANDLARADVYRGVADWLLLDAKPPDGAALPGGNGVPFDWTILRGLDRSVPLMLSGGLDAGNVGAALASVRPEAVDVSSGVEDRPGAKSPDKIRAFIRQARAGASQEEALR